MDDPTSSLSIAYLTNCYPAVSHSFIRREIAALETLGLSIERVSLRPAEADLPDPADQEERAKTCVLLQWNSWPLFLWGFVRAMRAPGRLLRSLYLSIRLGFGSERGMFLHLAYLMEAMMLAEWASRRGIDHLHAHFATNPSMVALLCKSLGGPSYSFTAHGPEPFEKAEWIRLRHKVSGAAFVVGISGFGVAQVKRYSDNADHGKIHRVRCGLDEALLSTAASPVPEAPFLVFVGRLCAEKDPLALLRSAERLIGEFPDLLVTFVGDGPLRGTLLNEAKARGLEDHVRFLGSASEGTVLETIRSARCLVLPSLAEGLPVVLMEAFAMGRPVVATAVAGIPELVVSEENGWLVPAGAGPELDAALQEVLTRKPSRLAEMAALGRDRVVARHSVLVEARTLARLFERYVGAVPRSE